MDKIIGYRLWRLSSDYAGYSYKMHSDLVPEELHSCGVKGTWHPGSNKAKCQTGQPGLIFGVRQLRDVFNKHQSPAAKCTCGFWAFKDLETLRKRNSFYGIGGMVLGSGKVISHTYGFRAERMEIVALFPLWEYDLTKLLRTYSIPILEPANALLLAKEKGGLELDNVPQEWKKAKINTKPDSSLVNGSPSFQMNLPITMPTTTTMATGGFVSAPFQFYNVGQPLTPASTVFVQQNTNGHCPICLLIPSAQPGPKPGDTVEVTCTCGTVNKYQRL